MRKIKMLGVTVAALLALSAVVASAASATNFTASNYPTAATAEGAKGNDDFKTEAGNVECRAHFSIDALEAPSETATVTPTYTECQAFGFSSATVSMNGCDYVLHATDGGVDVECPAGKAIQIVASTCEATIGTQTTSGLTYWIGSLHVEVGAKLKGVALSNSGTGIRAQATVKEIAYTVTKDGFLCPFNGTGAKTGGEYRQNFSVLVSSTNGTTIDVG